MITKSLKPLFFASLILLSTSGLDAAEPVVAAPTEGSKAEAPKNEKPITYPQLRNYLMDFADQYMQMVGQGADALKKSADADTRIAAHSAKLFPCSSAFLIASDSNPHMALLDMVVLVHLQGSIWREHLPKRFGDSSKLLLEAQAALEEDIDLIAERVLSKEKFDNLLKLVEDWRAEHPNQRYVAYIRFSDFADARPQGFGRRRGGNSLSLGSLLSAFQLVNIDEASRSVDQVRMTAERAIYLSMRMPTLLRWQTEMLFYELATTPEMKNLQKLPEILEKERKAAIWQITWSAILVLVVAFVLAVLYKWITRKF